MYSKIFAAVAGSILLVISFKALTEMSKSLESNREYALLPEEKEGQFPITMPDYDGVEQLIVLSNQWVIVVTQNLDDVVKKISELTDGQYRDLVNRWEDSQKSGRLNWTLFRTQLEPMRNQWIAQGRELAGERDLDSADYFSITSPDDANYKEPQQPLRTTRNIVSLGQTKRAGNYDVEYAHYSYLELPFPMQTGDTYTISLKNNKKVTFTYDEKRTISRAIKVNQVGYLSDDPEKFAYLGAYLQEFGPLDFSSVKDFEVINVKTGATALRGQVQLRQKNQTVPLKPGDKSTAARPFLTGEDVYELNLSPLTEEGEFFISIPGVGRSWTFHNGKDAFGEAFYISARGLYHQRSGIEIGMPYSAWPRQLYTYPVYESENIPMIPPIKAPKDFVPFDIIGATIDYTRPTEDATGGWHDAADWDRNITHYTDIFDLLGAYEIAPEKFYDGQLNLPESGNGIPDILDEAEYGLLVWKKSMTPEGGVAGAVETWTHPRMMDPNVHYAYSLRTRWSSLLFAAAAAKYSRLVQPFSEEKGQEYADLALRAYTFGMDPKNSLGEKIIHAAKDRGKGAPYTVTFVENEADVVPYQILAKLQMFLLTDDKDYLEGIADLLKNAPKPYANPFSPRDLSPWIYWGLFSEKVATEFPELLINQWKQVYLKAADGFVKDSPTQPYRQSWPIYQDYWMAWGSTVMTNQARALLLAYHLVPDSKYKEAAIRDADFMLGANPMGMSWTTGLGFVYPIEIQHEISEEDGIKDPVPGILIYGISGGIPGQVTSQMWQAKRPDGSIDIFQPEKNRKIPLWRQWMAHPHINTGQNEFTIHETMSGAIFTYAMLMPEGWMPSEALKNKKPRKDEFLFGYWYLP